MFVCKNLHSRGAPINSRSSRLPLNSGKVTGSPPSHTLILKTIFEAEQKRSFVFLSFSHPQHTNTLESSQKSRLPDSCSFRPTFLGPHQPPPWNLGVRIPHLSPLQRRKHPNPEVPTKPKLDSTFAKQKSSSKLSPSDPPSLCPAPGPAPPSGPSHFSQTKLPGNFLLAEPRPPAAPQPQAGR